MKKATKRFHVVSVRESSTDKEPGKWIDATTSAIHPDRPARVYVDAASAFDARDLACRFFGLSRDQVKVKEAADPHDLHGALIVEGEMGVTSVIALATARDGPEAAPTSRLSPMRQKFIELMVRFTEFDDAGLLRWLETLVKLAKMHDRPTKEKKAKRRR